MARIDQLPPTVLPSEDHVFPAMKDGNTFRLKISQIREALKIHRSPLYETGTMDDIPLQNGYVTVTGVTGAPTNGAFLIETVVGHSGDFAWQYAYAIGGNTGREAVYRRVRAGAGWSPWFLVKETELELNDLYVRRDSELGYYAKAFEGDLNALLHAGRFLVAEANVQNKPIANETFIIENHPNWDGSWVVQYAYRYTVMNNNGNAEAGGVTLPYNTKYRRVRRGGAWTAWEVIYESLSEAPFLADSIGDGGALVRLISTEYLRIEPAAGGRLVIEGVSHPVRQLDFHKSVFAGNPKFIYAFWSKVNRRMEYEISETLPASDLDAGRGRMFKTGDLSRVLIGACVALSTDGNLYDNPNARLCLSWFNRRRKSIMTFVNGSTASTGDMNIPNVVYFLAWPLDAVQFSLDGYVTTNALDHVFTSVRVDNGLGSTHGQKCTVGEYKSAGGQASVEFSAFGGSHAVAGTLRTTGAATATISGWLMGSISG